MPKVTYQIFLGGLSLPLLSQWSLPAWLPWEPSNLKGLNPSGPPWLPPGMSLATDLAIQPPCLTTVRTILSKWTQPQRSPLAFIWLSLCVCPFWAHICPCQVTDSAYFILYIDLHSALIALFITIVSFIVTVFLLLYVYCGLYILCTLIFVTTTLQVFSINITQRKTWVFFYLSIGLWRLITTIVKWEYMEPISQLGQGGWD